MGFPIESTIEIAGILSGSVAGLFLTGLCPDMSDRNNVGFALHQKACVITLSGLFMVQVMSG